MTSTTIRVLKNGVLIDTVERPVHHRNGHRIVKFKRKFWILQKDNSIFIDQEPYQSEIAEEVNGDDENTVFNVPLEQAVSPETEIGAAPIVWTTLQNQIIQASRSKRLLVSACPGTGKTATVCARVAWLIENADVPPSNLIVVSFSRTAVKEIRNRIESYLSIPNFASSIPIATIDSYAWLVHTGFSAEELKKPLEKIGYEENIAHLIKVVREDPLVHEYLSSLSHVLVDEAQDIVGIRADLIEAIFDHLSDDCGITVLGDEAQSIYGFSEESSGSDSRAENLITKIRSKNKFEEIELTEVHRTSSPQLKKLFTEVRSDVLKLQPNNAEGPAQIAELVRNASCGNAVQLAKPEELAGASNAFVLYRRRVEALQASSFFSASHVSHRIRISGLPPCIYPWIGALFSNYTDIQVDRDAFIHLWENQCNSEFINCGFNVDQAWELLRQLESSRSQVIKLGQIRKILGRSQPPLQFCLPDFGLDGPVIGTIHASKGREADNVHLLIPQNLRDMTNPAEEARILFVGGTRAKKELHVGNGTRIYARNIGTRQRVVGRLRQGQGQVQIGCSGDVSAQSVAGREYFKTQDEVASLQLRFVRNTLDLPLSLTARRVAEADYAYMLINESTEEIYGWLDKRSFNHDLWDAGKYILDNEKCRRLPSYFKYVWMHGLRTIVLPPDSIDCQTLHEPWANSGFMLAPMISTYTNAYF